MDRAQIWVVGSKGLQLGRYSDFFLKIPFARPQSWIKTRKMARNVFTHFFGFPNYVNANRFFKKIPL